jgi:hypothetical protein
MFSAAIRDKFAKLLDVPAGNGLWARLAGVLQWIPLDTDSTLAADSDTSLPSQKAVKAYVDAESAARTAGDTAEATARDVAITTHAADTTGVHGIADTSMLETQDGAQAKADAAQSAAEAASDPVGTAATAVAAEAAARAAGDIDTLGAAAGLALVLGG